ncbi:N-acetyllactosaminide beta-1,3-N-acetylglucosaminyltransferase [Cyphomyrmex costatus]|uniref:N-acetyllactosaminide beta-1,3-N-acetylglucosaminyltransferase n=1 Tax=Cyphomyrmex costatus TaxID=456900 RepID=A0A151IB73_9HYME|nr:N-acetyllactosaminide beta-1,3-N-acetylglucosaminyltransferase [Cyphomyrmex costatus]
MSCQFDSGCSSEDPPFTFVLWNIISPFSIDEKIREQLARVLPFVLFGAIEAVTKNLPQVTLSTHATADQVYGIVELARRWEGPLSLAVFAPGLDAGLAVAQLDRACRCEPAIFNARTNLSRCKPSHCSLFYLMTRRSQVSVHLVFPAGRPPALGAICSRTLQSDCAASDLQWRQAETERWKRKMTYPINVARNVARTMANTSRVLVSDIELLPSARLASGFMEMVHQRPPKHGVVFVVPIFEIESNEPPPVTKRELLAACRAGLAVYFHRYNIYTIYRRLLRRVCFICPTKNSILRDSAKSFTFQFNLRILSRFGPCYEN